MGGLKKSIVEAIKTYNKYRSPEAEAKLIKYEDKELFIEFKGPFCQGCGVYDYFEDFIYEIKGIVDVEMEIKDVEKIGEEAFRVQYSVGERKDTP